MKSFVNNLGPLQKTSAFHALAVHTWCDSRTCPISGRRSEPGGGEAVYIKENLGDFGGHKAVLATLVMAAGTLGVLKSKKPGLCPARGRELQQKMQSRRR